jgi:hypothetical protein
VENGEWRVESGESGRNAFKIPIHAIDRQLINRSDSIGINLSAELISDAAVSIFTP